jgi:MIP family channel proteins
MLAETIGTFALVFFGTGAIVINDLTDGVITHLGIALTFGLIVMSMIYAVGDISGAHMNPAVTVGFWVAKRFPLKRIPGYILAQLTGASLASAALWILFPGHANYGATIPSGSWHQALLLEFILSLMLMFVILSVAVGAKETGILAGIAIGGYIALAALVMGPICGASMNPARSFGPALYAEMWSPFWIYVAGPIAGAALSVPIWLATSVKR